SSQRQNSKIEPTQTSRFAELARRVNPRWWPYLLLLSDAVLILVAFAGAYYLRYQLQWFRAVDPAFQLSLLEYTPFALALVALGLLAFRFSGVYPYRVGRSPIEET